MSAASNGTVWFLGRRDSRILHFLQGVAEPVRIVGPNDGLPAMQPHDAPRLVLVHGYRRIIRAEELRAVAAPVINCHLSFLPWNRGADPNLWSAVEGSPAGVSIHHVDAGIDTGDLIAQERLEFDDTETLATSYEASQAALAALFSATWQDIVRGRAKRWPQPPGGCHHRTADRATIEHLLTAGWDTPLGALRGAWRREAPR